MFSFLCLVFVILHVSTGAFIPNVFSKTSELTGVIAEHTVTSEMECNLRCSAITKCISSVQNNTMCTLISFGIESTSSFTETDGHLWRKEPVCNRCIDFDTVLPDSSSTEFTYVTGYVGRGVQLLNVNDDKIEINTTGMSRCILTTNPADCTNGGATYMFWIKLLDTTGRGILTTLSWGPGHEGIKVKRSNDKTKMKLEIYRLGSERFDAYVSGILPYVGSWFHVAVVWLNYPKFEVYFNGMQQTVYQNTTYAQASFQIGPNADRVVVGKTAVDGNHKTANMIFDELNLYDRPLTEIDVKTIVNAYS